MQRSYRITVNGRVYEVLVEETELRKPRSEVQLPNQVAYAAAPPAAIAAAPQAAAVTAAVTADGAADAPDIGALAHPGPGTVFSPIPGAITAISVVRGQPVKRGDALVVLEAMKMANDICADQDGVVADIFTRVGASVNAGDPLARIV
jgi:biotin carboxyl carrier protein